MRALVERVTAARVIVDGKIVARIEAGLLVYVGVSVDDQAADVAYIVDKVRRLRIFPDDAGKMNRDVAQADGAILAISAFSLMADARKGRRPGFDAAARPEFSEPLYREVCDGLRAAGLTVETGRFGAMMRVDAINDGPICILLDSKRLI